MHSTPRTKGLDRLALRETNEARWPGCGARSMQKPLIEVLRCGLVSNSDTADRLDLLANGQLRGGVDLSSDDKLNSRIL